MKFLKRGLALFLAVMLMVPAQLVTATEPSVSGAAGQEEALKKEAASETDNTDKQGTTTEGAGAAGQETPGGETSSGEKETVSQGSAPKEETANQETPTEGEETVSQGNAPKEEGNTEPEADSKGEGSVSQGSVSQGSVSQDSVSQGSVSQGSVSQANVPKEPSEEILFNTGSCVYSVVGKEDFYDNDLGDACFEDDGSYTIHIPEENPFFPYEVQFTHEGKVSNQWFMTPDDSVDVGGHTFYVSAYFDGTVVTQMSLQVAGDTVIVYPDKKEFKDGDGAVPASLLPLTERDMNVDLSAFTPAELTMVSVADIFAGTSALGSTDKVAWTYYREDDYKISSSGDMIDLSYHTYSGTSETWQMIVGDGNQLAGSNIRYLVDIKTTESKSWLTPTVYTQDSAGNRANVRVAEYGYRDYNKEGGRELDIRLPSDKLGNDRMAYVNFTINPSVFSGTRFNHFRVYEGKFASAAEAVSAADITDRICCSDMTVTNAGYAVTEYESKWITMVTFDGAGKATGCLPFYLDLSAGNNYINGSMLDRSTGNDVYVSDYSEIRYNNDCIEVTKELYGGYPANKEYYLTLSFYEAGVENNAAVTGAYVGKFASVAEAAAAGAADIKNDLFFASYGAGGYPADYSQGVYFTVFASVEGGSKQEIHHYCFKAKEGTAQKNSGTAVRFNGLKDKNGVPVSCYVVDEKEDSYAEYNYLTILVNENTDLTDLAPEFSTDAGINLYAAGSSSPEVSGVSRHDFSQGAVQYTAAAENGTSSKNYWLQIVKATRGAGWLYVNSLADARSETRTENGVVYSTREIMLDNYHGGVHDILLANMGTDNIAALSVELQSDTVELDSYWTLNGAHDLSGCTTLNKSAASYGELPNLAKIRLKAKGGVASGTDISGTLTVKSGGNALMVYTLTGTIGDPVITTKEIPQAVKYVPYGTMIQNNNKYSWNTVTYDLTGGELPAGMEVKANGELYGVPLETGTFTFSVKMTNSYHSFSNSTMTYTLVVLENSDANVDSATDPGYELSQRIQNITTDAGNDQTLVSQGIYAEFVDIYLDGVKLRKDVDYSSESGSTRITIRSQTLKASNTPGTHTLGVEFRTQDNNTLKRAAQNYQVNAGGSGNGGSSSSSGGNSHFNQESVGANFVNTLGPGMNMIGNFPQIGNEEAVISYTVQKGDTLWKIAEKFFGSGVFWKKIFEDNRDVISDPNKIYAGQVIKIKLLPTGNVPAQADGDVTYYTIESGDSLWKIAKKFYGKGWKWREIYHANKDITDPKKIRAGQVIIIPKN